MHGEKDYRVPVTQGFEYYNTLRIKGVPTRLVYFPDENHWILKPQNSRLWHREFFAWLDQHLGPDGRNLSQRREERQRKPIEFPLFAIFASLRETLFDSPLVISA